MTNLTRLLWNRDDLVDFLKGDESEVRYWAIDRLIRHFPEECADEIAESMRDQARNDENIHADKR